MRLPDIRFFVAESFRALKLHVTPNVVSVACITLALLTLSFLMGGWWNLEHLLGVARSEAEIVVYLSEGSIQPEAEALAETLSLQPGVESTRVVGSDESLERIEALLGPGLNLLELMEGENPFPLSIEVGVAPEAAVEVARVARGLRGVETVRDNEEILAPLANLTRTVRWLGVVASACVIATVLALASHIVRLGISSRREEMETLRLMGASEMFVSIPFILEGLIVGFLGGLVSLLAMAIISPGIYRLLETSLPFMPLLPWSYLFKTLSPILLMLGAFAGTLGGIISIRSSG